MELICDSCRLYWDVSGNDNVNALYQAICYQHLECVKFLVEEGTDVNHEMNQSGYITTLLETAGRNNANVEIVKVLIDAGADVNIGAIEPVLVLAVQYGNVEVVKALIDAGADMNPRSYLLHHSPLATAVSDKKTECLKLLLHAGADVNHVYNKRALTITAESGYDRGISLLIDAGADVNQRDSAGRSTLFLAAIKRHIKCMKLLIKNGAHVAEVVKHHQWRMCYHQNVDKYQWILFAAGVDMSDLRKLYSQSIPAYPPEEQMNLMHLCREAIRNHLLQMSPVNLFVQVPQLGLPNSLQKYLLYNVSLDDDDDEI